MKKILILILVLLIPKFVYCEVTRKITDEYLDQTVKEITYYDDGEEIAVEKYNNKGNRVGLKGKIPNGLVRQY